MKTKKKEFKTISKRPKKMLEGEEGFDVEFKESVKALESSDLVAFANSHSGGTILVGIREKKRKRGRSKAQIIGCPIGDGQKQRILGKAGACVPGIDVEIITENLNKTPFYRIEIPSGKNKPYATLGGTYKIRDDGRTKALLPGSLLNMFLESESDRFFTRFTSATKELESQVKQTHVNLLNEMNNFTFQLQDLTSNTEEKLDHIFGTADNAEALSDEAMGFAEESATGIEEIKDEMYETNKTLLNIKDDLTALSELLGFNENAIDEIKLTREIRFFIRLRKQSITKKEILTSLKEQYPQVEEAKIEKLFEGCWKNSRD